MNTNMTAATRLAPFFLAGAFFWSSWLQTARLALITRTPAHAVAMQKAAITPRQRLEFSQKLGLASKDAKPFSVEDLKVMKKTFGSDADKMLGLLQQSAQ